MLLLYLSNKVEQIKTMELSPNLFILNCFVAGVYGTLQHEMLCFFICLRRVLLI